MKIRKAVLLAVAIAACSPILTVMASQGTPKEQAACRSDVRRYCSAIKAGSDGGAFLSCLQAHRAKLNRACLAVLVSHGQ
jgi:hypothetical protein